MVNLKLREYIDKRGISLMHIHEKTGIRYATICNIINGKVNTINLKYLQKIMEVINVSDMNLILEVDREEFDNRE